MRRIEGIVQHYAWGDPEFIPTLLGIEPDGRPWAELWLGTHPNGPPANSKANLSLLLCLATSASHCLFVSQNGLRLAIVSSCGTKVTSVNL